MAPLVAIYLLWGMWFLSWVCSRIWVSPTIKRAGTGREILYRVMMLIGIVLLFGLYSNGYEIQHRFWDPLRGALGWAMLVPVVAGLSFCWWARIHLGPLWSGAITRKNNHHIVDTGPYALVRHPIYAGTMLAVLATAFLNGTPSSFLGAALMALGFYTKARREERFLREELGPDAYDAYAKRVPMLVPFLKRAVAAVHMAKRR
ncbi:MAG TPA: isoprenylcysteine carboxylmethyltransferase family protein [Rhizomicrobium sp.]